MTKELKAVTAFASVASWQEALDPQQIWKSEGKAKSLAGTSGKAVPVAIMPWPAGLNFGPDDYLNFYNDNAVCQLETFMAQHSICARKGEEYGAQAALLNIRSTLALLEDAGSDGLYLQHCDICGHGIPVGAPTRFYDDVGTVHADCGLDSQPPGTLQPLDLTDTVKKARQYLRALDETEES